MCWLVLGKEKDILISFNKISFVKGRMWDKEKNDYFTRIFMSQNNHHFNVYEKADGNSFEEIKEKLLLLSRGEDFE